MRRRALVTVLLLAAGLLAAPALGGAFSIRVGERAPEISGDHWINSPPLSMAGLRGRVVVVEFWTFG